MFRISTLTGTDVIDRKDKRVGRISHVLFHSEQPEVVGFEIERRSLFEVIPRRPTYLTWEEMILSKAEARPVAGRLPSPEKAWRGDIDWDATVIWRKMPVVTSKERRELGVVQDGSVDSKTGRLESIEVSSGLTEDIAVGRAEIFAGEIVGFDGEAIVVTQPMAVKETSGGVAATAGKGVAVAKYVAEEAAMKAARTTGRIYGKASRGLKKLAKDWKSAASD